MSSNSFLGSKIAKWVAIFGIWTLVGLFLTSQLALQSQLSENPIPFWRALSWQLSSGYVWFVFSPLILWLSTRFPFEKDKWKTSLPVHLGSSLLVSLILLAVDAFILPRLGYLQRFQLTSFFETYKIILLVNLHFSVAIYWAVVAIHQAILYYRKSRERELQTSQLEARLAQSRLQVLKMQLHPHFLFNTLNAISELVHSDPNAADTMLTDLSDLLRMSFESLEVQEISLKQELDFLSKYLEIEQMRFQDRLRVEVDISPETLDASVPNMILQPLVENAIKHGISPRAEGGRIDIRSIRNNGNLQISVSDDGLGMSQHQTESPREGVGLSNTRKRLRHLYGDKQIFERASGAESGVIVSLEIPFRIVPSR